MDQTNDESADLGRIRKSIARFRQLVPDSQTIPEEVTDNYEKKHLSTQERSCWEPLQEATPEPETFTEPQVPLTNPDLSRQQFNRLLHQYKRAVYEVYQNQIASDFGATKSL